MKNPDQISLVLSEADLQAFTDNYLQSQGIAYLRIPDRFWQWLNFYPVIGIKCWLRGLFGGLPDVTAYLPIDGHYSLAVMIELKKPGAYLRANQKIAAQALPWIVCRSPDEVQQAIENAKKIIGRISGIQPPKLEKHV